jgi:hypothetical protein
MVLLMSVRETLLARPDIPDDEVDDIVAIAARLKDEDPARAGGATEAEVAEVAAELDIEAEYVQAALEQWRTDKIDRVEADKLAAQARKAASARRKALMWGVLASIVLIAMGSLGLATLGAARINGAHHHVVTTQAQLGVVLERQAALAPQLVALGGGDPTEIAALAADVGSTGDMESRLSNSRALGLAMAKEMNGTHHGSRAELQILLNLQHEVTGTQNRISTESRRYRAAQAAHREVAGGLTGWLATGYGLATAPE